MEMIHMILYEEESKGLDDPRGYIQNGPRAVTRHVARPAEDKLSYPRIARISDNIRIISK